MIPDHVLRYKAIARRVGIIQGETALQVAMQKKIPVGDVPDDEYDAIIVHGNELDNMSDEHWDRILAKKEIVFARLVYSILLEVRLIDLSILYCIIGRLPIIN